MKTGMLKTNHRFSKLSLSLAAAVVLSTAAGVSRANPSPTGTDEARALAGKASNANAAVVPMSGATTTDEARALASRSLVNSSRGVVVSSIATSTDQARAFAAVGSPRSVEKERAERAQAIVSTTEHH